MTAAIRDQQNASRALVKEKAAHRSSIDRLEDRLDALTMDNGDLKLSLTNAQAQVKQLTNELNVVKPSLDKYKDEASRLNQAARKSKVGNCSTLRWSG
jgi:chromosome segregation ATPase